MKHIHEGETLTSTSSYTREELRVEYEKTLLQLARGKEVTKERLEDLLTEAMLYV